MTMQQKPLNYINSEMYVIESDPSHCLADTLLFTFLLQIFGVINIKIANILK
jgi:hypothetical protein